MPILRPLFNFFLSLISFLHFLPAVTFSPPFVSASPRLARRAASLFIFLSPIPDLPLVKIKGTLDCWRLQLFLQILLIPGVNHCANCVRLLRRSFVSSNGKDGRSQGNMPPSATCHRVATLLRYNGSMFQMSTRNMIYSTFT